MPEPVRDQGGDLEQRATGHANLVAYTERMNRRYFGDHPPGRSIDATDAATPA